MNDADIIAFIKEFLAKLQVEFDSVERVETRLHPIYAVTSSESAKLIGNHGETLRALNLIIEKCVEEKTKSRELQVSVDVNGYKLKHIETVEESARLAGERARSFKQEVEMEPMSAYDRLIVHSYFAENPELVTESLGEGDTRRVVIKLRA